MNTRRPYLPKSMWAFFMCLVLGSLAAGLARATTVGETVTFNDLTDTVSVTQSGGSRYFCLPSPAPEDALCRGTAPTGAAFASSTFSNPNGAFNLVEPGTTDTLSDSLGFNAPPFTLGLVALDFASDADAGVPELAGCGNPGVICMTEDGTVQTAGTITWSDGTVDTIKVQSDVETPSTVPEPGTLVLFGSGLISIVGFARRKLFGL